MAAALEAAAGGIVDRPEAGALLREKLFEPGQSVRWDRLVEQASGAPLSVAPLAREVARPGVSDVAPLVDEPTVEEEERKTSYLELFFDLVFVFAFTQVTALILEDTSLAGLRAGGARPRDGLVGVVGVRVDDERHRHREHASRV